MSIQLSISDEICSAISPALYNSVVTIALISLSARLQPLSSNFIHKTDGPIEKLFIAESKKEIRSEYDLAQEVALYKTLTSNPEQLQEVQKQIPQLSTLTEQTMQKIKAALENPDLPVDTFKKFTPEELENLPELRELLEAHGLVAHNAPTKETFDSICTAVNQTHLGLNEVVSASHEVEHALGNAKNQIDKR